MLRIRTSKASILLLIMMLLVQGCSGSKELQVFVPADASANTLADFAPCLYQANDIDYDAECGTLIVEENSDAPETRLIALPIIRVLALSEEPAEPIFWFSGGPGASNMHFQKLTGLIDNHDIVLVGYRGVDGSSILACPEARSATKGTGNNVLSEASITIFGDALRQCATRLTADGVDLMGYSIPHVVGDMESARIALGYEQINLISQSYGTRVAMFYAWLHPETIHRSILIAVNPPGHYAWDPDTIDNQIRYDAKLCAQDAECSARTNDLAATMQTALNEMPDQWLGFPINKGKVRFVTYMTLFYRNQAAIVFDTYLAAEEGDYSGFALMTLMYDMMMPSAFVWGEAYAVSSIDYDPERDWMSEMVREDSILGSPGTMFMFGALQLTNGWPIPPIPEDLKTVQPSDVEMLLIGGSADYSTPPQFATNELLPMLSNGQQVIVSEFGHSADVWDLQPEAMIHLVTNYYETGEADDSLFTYQPMNFDVKYGLPFMAKTALGVIVALTGIIALIIVLVFWRVLASRSS